MDECKSHLQRGKIFFRRPFDVAHDCHAAERSRSLSGGLLGQLAEQRHGGTLLDVLSVQRLVADEQHGPTILVRDKVHIRTKRKPFHFGCYRGRAQSTRSADVCDSAGFVDDAGANVLGWL